MPRRTEAVTNPRGRRALRWLFGGEGGVAAEPELQVVVTATATAMAGLYAMSPILSALTGPFAISDAQVGAIITAYTAPSVLLVPVVGLVADRLGRRRLLVGGLVLFGAGGAAVALTTDFTVVLLLRVVQGIGFAAINPLGVTLIGDFFEGSRETTAQGLRVAGIQLSSLAIPPVAGALVLAAWQFPFLLYGLALPVAVWAWVALPEAAPVEEPPGLQDYLADLASLLQRPTLAAVQLSFVARFALSVGFITYVSVLLSRTFAASAVETGLVVSGVGLVALVGSTQVGRLVASRDHVLVLILGLFAVGGGVVVMGVDPSILAVGTGGVLLGAGMGVSGPVQKSLVTRLAPPELRAGAVSTAILFQSIGQAVGPLVLGLFVAWMDVASAFVAFGVLGTAAGGGLVAVAYARSRGP